MAETTKEKTDRQLIELLNELRVMLPGAQILLGFLLTAPFATRFQRATHLDRVLLFACALVTAVAVLLLMAPAVYHRIRWNRGGKTDVIRVGHRLFLAGTSCLAIGMVLSVFVLGDYLFGHAVATASIVLVVAVVGVTWYVLPLERDRPAAEE